MLMTLAALALAAQSGPTLDQKTIDQRCADMGTDALYVMRERQKETPMAVMLKWADRLGATPKDIRRMMVMEAYETEAYMSETYREREALKFSNGWVRTCHEFFADPKNRQIK